MSQGCPRPPAEALGENSFLALFSSACSCVTPISASVVTLFPSLLCVCLYVSVHSYNETCDSIWGPPEYPGQSLHLKILNHIYKDSFSL